MECNLSLEDLFYGAATVGERGQVVIPSEARKKYHISSGDKVLVVGHPGGGGIMLCKIDAMRGMFSSILADLEAIETKMAESGADSHKE